MGLFGHKNEDKNIAPGDASTEGLPRRINKKARQDAQATAAKRERYAGSFEVPDRPGRPHGDYNASGRD